MIRILHIVHALTKGDGLLNFIMNYYRNIDTSIIQFDFLYFDETENDFKEEIVQLGGRYYKLPKPSFGLTFRKARKDFFKIHRNDYVAIHCHALFANAFFYREARKNGLKVISHSHNTIYGVGFFRKIRNFFLVKSCKYHSDYYISCGEKAGRFMFGNKLFDSNKVIVFHNAINASKYAFNLENRDKIRKEYGFDNQDLVIGLVGSFCKQKNHEFLIDVFKYIKDKKKNVKMLLIGGDALIASSTKQVVVDKINSYSLNRDIILPGLCSNVNEYLSAFDLYVMPSLFEGLPFSVIEAQANGLPVILSDNVTKEVNLGLCTYLPLGNPREWADYILSLVFNNDSRKLGKRLIETHGYDIKSETIKLQKFYESISIKQLAN